MLDPTTIDKWRSSRGIAFIASAAFMIRFNNTCWLNSVTAYYDRVLCERRRDADVAQAQIALRQLERFGHDVIQIDRLKLCFASFQQSTQASDHLPGAFVVTDDVVDDGAYLVQINESRLRNRWAACALERIAVSG